MQLAAGKGWSPISFHSGEKWDLIVTIVRLDIRPTAKAQRQLEALPHSFAIFCDAGRWPAVPDVAPEPLPKYPKLPKNLNPAALTGRQAIAWLEQQEQK